MNVIWNSTTVLVVDYGMSSAMHSKRYRMWTADAEMNCQQLSQMIEVNKKVLIEEFFFSTLERNISSKL